MKSIAAVLLAFTLVACIGQEPMESAGASVRVAGGRTLRTFAWDEAFWGRTYDPCACYDDVSRQRCAQGAAPSGWYKGQLWVRAMTRNEMVVEGSRLALPQSWNGSSPIRSMSLSATSWRRTVDLNALLYWRAAGTGERWRPVNCGLTGEYDADAFVASHIGIDFDRRELEVRARRDDGRRGGAGQRSTSIMRWDQCGIGTSGSSDRYDDPRRGDRYGSSDYDRNGYDGRGHGAVELAVFVFPRDDERFVAQRYDYDLQAWCDGGPCPSYTGDPAEYR
jgi:hypothetical protein